MSLQACGCSTDTNLIVTKSSTEMRKTMKILSFILYVIGIVFCILAFAGHTAAWSAAALCFFAGYNGYFSKKKY